MIVPRIALGKPAAYGQEIVKRRFRLTAATVALSGKTVLDFGCGNGAQTCEFAPAGGKIFAVDTRAGFLKRMALNCPGCRGIACRFSPICRMVCTGASHAPAFIAAAILLFACCGRIHLKFCARSISPLDVVPNGRLKRLLQAFIFRGDATRLSMLATAILVHGRKISSPY